MKTTISVFSVLVISAVVCGCWTFSETPLPEIPAAVQCPADATITVAVNGFKATMVDYYAVYGYQSYYVPGGYGRHHYHPGYCATVPTTTYIPQVKPDEAFLMRARDVFETSGFVINAEKPDWTMEVVFEGPFDQPGDAASELCWPLFTVFFCDYAATGWQAKLRVRDNRTGKMAFHRDYVERYETKAFGLLPLFGIAACDQTKASFGKARCLSLLTERAIADATAEIVRLAVH